MAQSMLPVATWGLTVAPNDAPLGAFNMETESGTLQLTMAAIDPGEDISQNEGVEAFKKPRATVKMIVLKELPEDEDDDEEDMEMAELLDEDEDEESPNGEGPSDPKKSPKEMKRNAILKAMKKQDDDVLANGAKAKGKGKVSSDEEMEDDDEDDDEDVEDAEGVQEFVLCTLDPENHYNQPLNITIPAHEEVAFRVTGTHSIHLTGNIVISPMDDDTFGSETSEDEDEGVDLSPDEEELADVDEESDELDDMEDPRITEVGTDEEDEVEPPKLVKAEPAKAKNSKKRAREDDSSMLDVEDEKKPITNGILEKALKKEEAATPQVNGDVPTIDADGKPLSKSQIKKMRKKMKDNAGNAVTVTQTVDGADEGEKVITEAKKEIPGGKSVQFAEKLVQGPTPTTNGVTPKEEKKGGKTENPRVVDGVTIDDKKTGTGPLAKKGDKVSMRYIGKLESDKSQFDANKKGPPFTFRLGGGEVIKGWEIGVQGMAMGGERRIIVPAKHGYGSKKSGKIPANSTLIFDVKLLEINAKK